MNKIDPVALGRSLGPVITQMIENATAGLRARVAALEGRPPESWQSQRGYTKGTPVAVNGTIWIATRDNAGDTPGASDAWRLA